METRFVAPQKAIPVPFSASLYLDGPRPRGEESEPDRRVRRVARRARRIISLEDRGLIPTSIESHARHDESQDRMDRVHRPFRGGLVPARERSPCARERLTRPRGRFTGPTDSPRAGSGTSPDGRHARSQRCGHGRPRRLEFGHGDGAGPPSVHRLRRGGLRRSSRPRRRTAYRWGRGQRGLAR
jgi:hypothetical protein